MWLCRRSVNFIRRRSIKTDSIRFCSGKVESQILPSKNVPKIENNIADVRQTIPGPPFVNVETILNTNKCNYISGYTCFRTNCIACSKNETGNIYINKVTGYFQCMDCQEEGDLNRLKHKLKIPSTTDSLPDTISFNELKSNKAHDVTEDAHLKWKQLKQNFKLLSSIEEEEINIIIKSFDLPAEIDQKVWNSLDVLHDKENNILYFPVTNIGKRVVGIITFSKDKNEECYPYKKCPGVLKYIPPRVTRKCDQVIVVHKLSYFLRLASQKHNYHIICLPHGSIALPQEVLPLFEQYSRILFWFKNDKSNLLAAKSFSKKLIETRCYLVRDVEEVILSGDRNHVMKKIKDAQTMKPENIITFADLKDDLYSGLINTDQVI